MSDHVDWSLARSLFDAIGAVARLPAGDGRTELLRELTVALTHFNRPPTVVTPVGEGEFRSVTGGGVITQIR